MIKMFTKLLLLNNIYINIYIYIKMVKNKNKNDDEHNDIKEHYDENSFKASDIPWYSYLGMIAALFLLFAFGMWLKSRFFPTDKTKTIVPDSKEPTTVKPVIVTGDLVHPINGVTPQTGITYGFARADSTKHPSSITIPKDGFSFKV